MAKSHLALFFILFLLHLASSLKILTLVQPYLVQSPSTATLVRKEDDIPTYRDLPPIKTQARDLEEALEATRNLKYTRPPLDTEAFFASLKRAAQEARSLLVGEQPFVDLQIRKSDVMDVEDKLESPKEKVLAKNSNEGFHSSPKSTAATIQVKRSEGSEVGEAPLLNAASSLDVKVQAPFTDVQVRKLAVEEGEEGAVPIPDTETPLYNPEGRGAVGVNVQAPFTNVRVRKTGAQGTQVGVSVEAPFTNVKVKKLAADIPPEALPGVTYGNGGSYPEIGVRVEAPFVRVKVDGPAIKPVILDDGFVGKRPPGVEAGVHHTIPRRKPLDLDINIPGIFNLKLLRDENGRGRLGIGVLPVFTSMVNPHRPSDPYPGPPPS